MNNAAPHSAVDQQSLTFVVPASELGYQVATLVGRCPPLDTNSVYCNLLQCHHFAQTSCAVLTEERAVVGFVSGYLVPSNEPGPDTLFIWQVAVDESQRGKALGMRMMQEILSRDSCRNVRFLETTVTDDNKASGAMFQKLATSLGAPDITKSILFDRQKHFMGLHDSEVLYRIGPFKSEMAT